MAFFASRVNSRKAHPRTVCHPVYVRMILGAFLASLLVVWFGPVYADLGDSAGDPIVLADEPLDLDPEAAEGDFEERAHTIQQWLQKRELERIDMGLSHQYERPRAIDDADEEDSDNGGSGYGRYKQAGRGLFVRLRRPSYQFHNDRRTGGGRGRGSHLSRQSGSRHELRIDRKNRSASLTSNGRFSHLAKAESRHVGGNSFRRVLIRPAPVSHAKSSAKTVKHSGSRR